MPIPVRAQETIDNATCERDRYHAVNSHFLARVKQHVNSLGPNYEARKAERDAAYRRAGEFLLELCAELDR